MHRTKNATIEVIIEDGGFNNSLAGSLNCPNAWVKSTGAEAQKTWVDIYLKDGALLAWDRLSRVVLIRCSRCTFQLNDERL